MLTKRADEIPGESFALVNVATDLTNVALFVGLGLGLYVVLIIGICHRGRIGYLLKLGHRADKHTVSAKVNVLLYSQ